MTGESLTLFSVDGAASPDALTARRQKPRVSDPGRSITSESTASTLSASRSTTAAPVAKLLLTPTEAATALGIGRSKLYELMKCGRLESVLIDSSRRIPSTAVENYVDELRRSTGGSTSAR
jgi:excisionase family DNA binding protein